MIDYPGWVYMALIRTANMCSGVQISKQKNVLKIRFRGKIVALVTVTPPKEKNDKGDIRHAPGSSSVNSKGQGTDPDLELRGSGQTNV